MDGNLRRPKMAYELVEDPVLGEIARGVNSICVDLYMVQQPEVGRFSWLRRMASDAEALRAHALALLKAEGGSP